MEEWKTYRLEELSVGKGSYGIGAAAIPYDINKYTYLRITDIYDDGTLNKKDMMSVEDENAKKYLLKENDIVFARTGNSTGRTYFYDGSDGKLIYAGFLIKFSLDPKKVNPRILKYYTHSKPYYDFVKSFDTGGTRGNINAKTFGSMQIKLPPRKVQDKIVEILKSLDDKIEINHKINDNLEQQAQALFKSWFVDFEPFREGKFIDSELGKIPEGWRVGSIGEIIHIYSGFAFKSRTFLGNGKYKLITIKNVQDGFIEVSGTNYIDETPSTMPPYCLLSKGDILLSLTGNVGRVCLVNRDNLLLNQRVAKLQPFDDYNKMFIYTLFRHEAFKNILIQLAKGTAQLNLSPIETAEIKIIIPSNDVLHKFGTLTNNYFESMIKCQEQNIVLTEYRDALLPKLMSGKIKISY